MKLVNYKYFVANYGFALKAQTQKNDVKKKAHKLGILFHNNRQNDRPTKCVFFVVWKLHCNGRFSLAPL